ncbi:MAG: choice-of-anchor D domain-containing protein, partial [Calditrichaeota bacterium]|nr:choice-of-anchor D domain-containing protein [Calditrichota bacterium]
GICLIGNAGFITGLNGLICVSYDGGLTWNPFTTNTSVHFYASAFTSASYGFAVGAGGTICVYNGSSWQPQLTNTSVTFYGVYALDNTAWAVGEGGTICRYVNGVWTPQVTNTSITFYDVAFVNRNFGYAVGADGTICRTRDGGLTWVPLVSGVNVRLRAIKILSPRVAYCLGDDGVVLETTDCGDTWTQINLDLPLELEALEIVDGQGFIAGDLGEAYRFAKAELSSYQLFSLSSDSLDAGIVSLGGDQSASVTVTNDGPAPLDISTISSDNSDFAISPASGIIAPGGSQVFDITFTPTVVGTASASISFSHDGDCLPGLLSVNANAIPASYSVLNTGVNVRLTGVSFIDALNGCVAGEGGTVLATSDGGQSWTSVGINPAIDLTGIKLVGGSAFLTGTNGHICRSDDGGQSWVPFTTNTSVTFHAASFLNLSHGWAVGGGGAIYYYNGVNWVQQTTNLSITFYGVYAIGNTAYAVGAQGTVCKFVNGVWVPVNPGVSNTFYACAFVNENFGYIVGSGGIICRTRNGGLTWEPLTSGVSVDLKACKV